MKEKKPAPLNIRIPDIHSVDSLPLINGLIGQLQDLRYPLNMELFHVQVGRVFDQYPNIVSFTLSESSRSEMGDEGQTYVTQDVMVSKLVLDPPLDEDEAESLSENIVDSLRERASEVFDDGRNSDAISGDYSIDSELVIERSARARALQAKRILEKTLNTAKGVRRGPRKKR